MGADGGDADASVAGDEAGGSDEGAGGVDGGRREAACGGAVGAGGEGGGGATTIGTTADPTVAFVVAVTLTPRLAEMAAAG